MQNKEVTIYDLAEKHSISAIAGILINHLDGEADLSLSSTVILNSDLIISASSQRKK
jgi:hypothetical protein